MQETYVHPKVLTLGAGLKTLKLVVGTSDDKIIVDLDERSVTSQSSLYSEIKTTVVLGKNEAEVEITVHKSLGAELRLSINFETRAVTPLGDSVISSFAPSMASFLIQQHLERVDKTLLVTQGSPPLATPNYDSPVPLFYDRPRESPFFEPDHTKKSITPTDPRIIENNQRHELQFGSESPVIEDRFRDLYPDPAWDAIRDDFGF